MPAVGGLVHGVTTRAGGVSRAPYDSLNLGVSSGDDPEAVARNREALAANLGFAGLVLGTQVHGARVARVRRGDGSPGEADGLVTDEAGVLLGVLGADCPGVLLVDERRHVLGVVHAGWRGVAGGVVPAAVAALRRHFGTRPEDVAAGIGPGISAARYEVSGEVAAAVAATLADADARDRAVVRGRPGHAHVDLGCAIALQLAQCGVARVARHGGCTYDDAACFFSHRRDGPRTGRHALVAGWSH